jgi:hypothetical protein
MRVVAQPLIAAKEHTVVPTNLQITSKYVMQIYAPI